MASYKLTHESRKRRKARVSLLLSSRVHEEIYSMQDDVCIVLHSVYLVIEALELRKNST